MVKQIIPVIALMILLGSCSSLKPLNFSGDKQVTSSSAVSATTTTPPAKFIDGITVTASTNDTKTDSKEKGKKETSIWDEPVKQVSRPAIDMGMYARHSSGENNVSALQLKYAAMLNTQADQLQNKLLLEDIDEWYGTRYRMGGTTKDGIDCSAFTCALYGTVFGISLPRTAKDQYHYCHRISRTELKEGDLLFFNTRGGVSHVGIYLQNNKFVHASTSQGVTISDMFEPYYLKRFICAGRVDNKQEPVEGH